MDVFKPLFCYYWVRFVIYLHVTLMNVKNVPRYVTKVIFGPQFFQEVKNFPNVFRFILWALAKKDFRQSYSAVSVSTLKLFEILISLASLYPVARTLCLCATRPFAQIVWTCNTIIMLSSLLYKQTFSLVGRQSNITDNFYYAEIYIQTFFFQNDLELFKWGASLSIHCGIAPNLHGEMPHTTYPKGMKYMTTTCCRG
jgi:hypothetical protein